MTPAALPAARRSRADTCSTRPRRSTTVTFGDSRTDCGAPRECHLFCRDWRVPQDGSQRVGHERLNRVTAETIIRLYASALGGACRRSARHCRSRPGSLALRRQPRAPAADPSVRSRPKSASLLSATFTALTIVSSRSCAPQSSSTAGIAGPEDARILVQTATCSIVVSTPGVSRSAQAPGA